MKVNPESDQLSSVPTHTDVSVGATGSEKFRQVLGGTINLAGQLAGTVAGGSTMGLAPLAGNIAGGLLGTADTGTVDPMQLLQLQEQLQSQSQVFNTMSNISKTEHETRMAAVRNMKE
jgi:outer membrane lipoprotein SlyB